MTGSETRPSFAIRVGVTGGRRIDPNRVPALRARTDEVLALVAAQAARFSSSPCARYAYARDRSGAVPVALRMISPLAEGADRLVAEAALDLGYDLVSPLPFSQTEYERDFEATKDTFRQLLSKAQVIEMDGGREAAETRSYEAVGRFVVRNCDLLIALWDGKPSRGQGGTAEIVRFSARAGIPVWWIDVATGETRFLANATHWRHLDLAPCGDAAKDALIDYVLNLVVPPIVGHPTRTGILGRLAHHYCRITGYNPHPLEVFLSEPESQPSSFIWQSFNNVYRRLAAPVATAVAPPPPNTDIQAYWLAHYRRADALSIAYGDRYRSSFVLVILIAFLAFAVSTIGAPLHYGAYEAVLEAILFIWIGGLVFTNHVFRWRERWKSYRLLAELCRNEIMLVPLGRTTLGIDAGPPAASEEPSLPREAWVSWYYLATLRASPCPPRSADEGKRAAFVVAQSLVAEQAAYHASRFRRAETADRRLTHYGDWFGGGLAAVLALVWMRTTMNPTGSVEIVVSLFSGASAAFFGLRGYAEFSLLAQQSMRMETIMRDTRAELDTLDLDEPLSSQDLGATLQHLAGAMMQDVGGWAQLFRLKTVDAG